VILSKINCGDVVVGERIVESSIAQSTLPINEPIPLFTPSTDNPLIAEKEEKKAMEELKQKKEEICKTVEGLLSGKDLKRKVLSTDILSSLHIAERVFATYPKEKKILVIFSDMIEESKDYNFSQDKLLSKRVDDIILMKRKKGRLPDLAGVKIYITGATAGTPDKFFAVQNFWLMYFKECGASLSKENYGATLLNFDE